MSELTFTIYSPTKEADFEAAFALLAQHWPLAEQSASLAALLAAWNLGRDKSCILLAAARGSQIVGAVCGNIVPGKTAGIYPPQLAMHEGERTAVILLLELEVMLMEQGVHLAQALLTLDADREQQRLLNVGYQHVADLLYLVSEGSQFPDHPPKLPFTLDRYDLNDQPRLEALIQTTYVGTLDCPLVDQMREPADVLAGYRAASPSGSAHWYIARQNGRDIGCLLLSEFPSDDQLEIVYLALVPEVRGRGWGMELTRFAQWQARELQRARVVLAVDAENLPAIQMYATCCFGVCDERSAFVKHLAAGKSS